MAVRDRSSRGAHRGRTARPAASARSRLLWVPLIVAVLGGGVLGMAQLVDGPDSVGLPTCEEVAPLSGGAVAGYSGEQLDHAATIMAAGAALGFDLEGQRLGVMAAMGESGLRNLEYGDWETSQVRNPDGTPTTSLGLFQQQEWWGSVEERMDPATAATQFFEHLAGVDGWQRMDPSRAIHMVQVNANPDHYTRWLARSGEVTVSISCAE